MKYINLTDLGARDVSQAPIPISRCFFYMSAEDSEKHPCKIFVVPLLRAGLCVR